MALAMEMVSNSVEVLASDQVEELARVWERE
jgi:hypothetical protein